MAANIAFQAFDIHGTGKIHQNDLEHALRALGLGDLARQQVTSILRSVRSKQAAQQQAALSKQQKTNNSSSAAHSPVTSSGPVLTPIAIIAPGSTGGNAGGYAGNHYVPPTVTYDEFLAVAKELTPHVGSNDELWKGFRAIDQQQKGRISLGLLMGSISELPEPSRLSASSMSQLMQSVAEYPDKGITFEEWKLFQVGLQQEFARKKGLKTLAA